MAKQTVQVKRYESDAEYQKDANKMLKQGFEVLSVTSEQPRSRCMRILTLGILFKPKPQLVVTYQRQSEKAAGS